MSQPAPPTRSDDFSRHAILDKLRSEIRGLERPLERPIARCVATPFDNLNAILPGRGLPLGAISEVIAANHALGALSLALALGEPLIAAGRAWAVVDSDESFYAPAAAALGLDLSKLVLIRTSARESAWAMTHLLRCPDISISFMASRSMDNMTYRRFQLAAERSGNAGILIRPLSALKRPCWAQLRLLVSAAGSITGSERLTDKRALEVTLIHARGVDEHKTVIVES